MSILTILTYPDPILAQTCSDVTRFDESLQKLIDDMFETMLERNGVGLAAPQVGLLQNLFVVQFEDRRLIAINPKIISFSGKTIDEEGCLSCPEANVKLERADKITLKCLNRKGKPITIKEKGFFSRIIQHESDHLSGIVILNKQG